MQLTCATDAPPIKCSGSGASDTVTNRHLVKLGLIKSERKRCPLLTTPPHCKNPPTIERSVRIVKREIRVRAYAAIAEIAVTLCNTML
ncbi:hypothetical protein EVAR_98496_1 [Eumeta japonica]|uniref:Uncharacterized protein n=1 Tax=Eumeta variegata TaxID=151549 RepID=A0A4C2ADB4_EUMVA|nr:hypothetical protein EVAR_98496_1 [Eumeta japonica]